jgi:peroxiredoxin
LIPIINPNPAPETNQLEVAPVVGGLAPDFELLSLSGESFRLSDFRGKVVLINFWATWCAPCRLEIPAIQDRANLYPSDLVVLAVDNNEPAQDVLDFVLELQLTLDPLLDPGAEVQQLYQVRGYPSSYFIDREGVIKQLHIGIMTEGQLDGYLEDLGISMVPASK